MFKHCKSSKVFFTGLWFTAIFVLGGCTNSGTANSANVELKTTPKESISVAEGIGILDVSLFPDEKNKSKFVIEINSVSGLLEPKAGTEFDVMNEYGFLAKAKLTGKDKDGFWNAEVIAGSHRSNLFKLAETRMLEREKESPNLPAFGVFPSDSKRSTINLGDKIDITEQAINYRTNVYRSLPSEAQNFGTSDAKGNDGNLGVLDGWSDLDGDGKIDFVVLRGKCNAGKNEMCSKKFVFQNDKWLEIPSK